MEKPAADGRVTDPRTLRALLVAGAAPGGVPQRIERVSEGPEQGIVVELEDGPGDHLRRRRLAVEKWTAALRVLADPDAAGATYIDVRLPERPVAGGLPVETIEPVAPAGEVVAPPVEPVGAGGWDGARSGRGRPRGDHRSDRHRAADHTDYDRADHCDPAGRGAHRGRADKHSTMSRGLA